MSSTRRLLGGSALTALVVGTVLTIVNQWESVRAARFDAASSAGATHGVGE